MIEKTWTLFLDGSIGHLLWNAQTCLPQIERLPGSRFRVELTQIGEVLLWLPDALIFAAKSGARIVTSWAAPMQCSMSADHLESSAEAETVSNL
jgi:hypothetical protein